MKLYQIDFSPTGGTARVADVISKALEMPVSKIDLSEAATDFSAVSLEKEDLAVIAVPSYGGRVPATATQRIEKINGNHAACVIVCVYGNRAYEDTLVELNDIAEKSGFRVIAAIAAVAEHSILRQYASGRPDSEDEAELRRFCDRILEKLREKTSDFSAPQIPGSRPYKQTGQGGLIPKANSKCTGCGLCAEKCPTQAISRNDLKLADSKKCISCMRCVALCPQGARSVNKVMVSAAALAIKKACSTKKRNELYL